MRDRGLWRWLIAAALIAASAALWRWSDRQGASVERAPPARGAGASTGTSGRADGQDTGSAPTPAAGGVGGSRPATAQRTETSDEARARLAQQALQRRALNDESYRDHAARWASEARDEPWSTDQERALRAAASGSGLDHLLIELECRRTLCRVEISAADSNTAFALQRARGFSALLGTETGSAAIGSGPDRALEVFAAREGMGSPRGP